jgi:uncharacterized membrane protein YhaH (DUF805 family)
MFWPTGRTSRGPYWFVGLFLNLASASLDRTFPEPILNAILTFIVGYMSICVIIGRLHDIDRSGWWCLPFFLIVAIGYGIASQLPRAYDAAAAILLWGSLIIFLGGSLYLGIKRGTEGPNRFGPNPIAHNVFVQRASAQDSG